ncbi:hypothetical protein CSKR_108994 [Clonorchis sinensis]|uniref:Uncharacterized protein n=1 Tax=Clonorchis sinensis TaxID=79923 RepID=A0A419PV67_CLOSI|nr:hypothetical protein CSKR_108994 [Clonorchis sinensis]
MKVSVGHRVHCNCGETSMIDKGQNKWLLIIYPWVLGRPLLPNKKWEHHLERSLGAFGAIHLPGWNQRDPYGARLMTLQDMIANQLQKRCCCLFLSRFSKEGLNNIEQVREIHSFAYQFGFDRRLTWNLAASLANDVFKQMNVLHRAISCLSWYEIRVIAIHPLKNVGSSLFLIDKQLHFSNSYHVSFILGRQIVYAVTNICFGNFLGVDRKPGKTTFGVLVYDTTIFEISWCIFLTEHYS